MRRTLAARLERHQDLIVNQWFLTQFDDARVERFQIAGVHGHDKDRLRDLALKPLLKLFLGYMRSANESLRAVYLDERLRYAPHQADPAVRLAYCSEVLTADKQAIADLLEDDPALAKFFGSVWDDIHQPLLAPLGANPVKLLAVGDCLMNEVRVFLPSQCRASGVDVDMRHLYFSAQQGVGLSVDQVTRFVDVFLPDLIALSFFSYEALPSYSALLRQADGLSNVEIREHVSAIATQIRKFLFDLRMKTDAPFLIHNASGLPLTRIRKYIPGVRALSEKRARVLQAIDMMIDHVVRDIPNCLLIDEWHVAEKYTHKKSAESVVPRAIYKNSLFHTGRFGGFVAHEYEDVIRSFHALLRAKVILVDFDNTLWKGVMADEAVTHDLRAQNLLRLLKEDGMLLVALSKNSPANIRWTEMALGPTDFVLTKINWNPKAQSIIEAAKELNLGLDAFVLIDDNPVERELVRSQLPMVQLLDSLDPFTWRSLRRLLRFPNTQKTGEAHRRTEMYREQADRTHALHSGTDFDALMGSLGLVAQFGPMTDKDLNRVEELFQRTNQFNTTTIRYSKAQLQAMRRDGRYGIYVGELADKFGDLGIVGVVVIERREADRVFESVVMSCRAMGFQFERVLLRLAMDVEEGVERFIGRFIPTDRNAPASTLFLDHGFLKNNETDWHLAADLRPPLPPWFAFNERGGAGKSGH